MAKDSDAFQLWRSRVAAAAVLDDGVEMRNVLVAGVQRCLSRGACHLLRVGSVYKFAMENQHFSTSARQCACMPPCTTARHFCSKWGVLGLCTRSPCTPAPLDKNKARTSAPRPPFFRFS